MHFLQAIFRKYHFPRVNSDRQWAASRQWYPLLASTWSADSLLPIRERSCLKPQLRWEYSWQLFLKLRSLTQTEVCKMPPRLHMDMDWANGTSPSHGHGLSKGDLASTWIWTEQRNKDFFHKPQNSMPKSISVIILGFKNLKEDAVKLSPWWKQRRS